MPGVANTGEELPEKCDSCGEPDQMAVIVQAVKSPFGMILFAAGYDCAACGISHLYQKPVPAKGHQLSATHADTLSSRTKAQRSWRKRR